MPEVKDDSAPTFALLEEAAAGDLDAIEKLLVRFRPDLVAFVDCRLDQKVQARFSSSDVVQEAQIEVARRMEDFLKHRPMPFHVWVRKITYQRLLNMQRDHRRRTKRSVDREVTLPPASSSRMAKPILAKEPTPSERVAARENAERVGNAVARLKEIDREILLMRHVEDLPYEEIGCLLDIDPMAARQRYGRALIRLRHILKEHGLLE